MSLTYSNVLNVNKKNYNGVTIEERTLSGKINIRGKSSDKEFMKSIGSVLNLVLPIEPNVRIFNNNISEIGVDDISIFVSWFYGVPTFY